MSRQAEPAIFSEEQRFGQVWLWAIIIGMDVVCFTLFFCSLWGKGVLKPSDRPTGSV
jgi:hypothetical protein